MNNYIVFLKKEFLESKRTYRLFLLLIIFLILGILSPLAAKLLPELLSSSLPDGMTLHLEKPASIDSWTQFYKNISQIGLAALIFIFCGTVSGEVQKETLTNLLTKGLNRPSVIWAKFTFIQLIWTLCLSAAYGVCYLYTVYYFPDNKSQHQFVAFVFLWLFGVLLMSLILFASTIAKTTSQSLLLIGFGLVLGFLSMMYKKIEKGHPLSLASVNVNLINGSAVPGDYWPAIISTLLLSFLFLLSALLIFNKRKI